MSIKKRLSDRAIIILDRIFPEPVTTWQHLRQNLLVGLFVSCLVVLFQGTDFVRSNREKTIDWPVNMQRGTASSEGKQRWPFVFYDIDERTYEAWGEPLTTPREKLANLLQSALELHPAVVIVDIELSRATPDDAQLLEVLRRHAQQRDAPTLILMQDFKWVEDSADKGHLLTRSSFLEQQLPPSASRIWASPIFERDKDGQFRRWKIWQSACSKSGASVLVPSVQIATLAALANKDARAAVYEAMQKAIPGQCGDEPKPTDIRFRLANQPINASADAFAQRILFALPWKLGEGETRPLLRRNGVTTRLLTVFPAHAVTEGHLKPDVPPGHIAIIGASHPNARDNQFTPLGVMPGSMILINAIHSVIQNGQMSTPPVWIQLLAASLMLIGVSFIFMKFHSLLGTVVSFIILGLLLIPMSIFLFRYGVWLDFALPLVAVKVFQLLMEYLRRYALHRRVARMDNKE